MRLGEENVSLRGYLRRFLFSEDRINSKISILSGGERSRVILAKILKRGGNVIILDEPTNDLDLSTLRMLEDALVLFGGTVLLVSHDRYFLNRVCTHILAFEGDGKTFYDAGDYDTYVAKRASREAALAPPPPAKAAPASAKSPKSRKLTFKEKKELEAMEATILSTENGCPAARAFRITGFSPRPRTRSGGTQHPARDDPRRSRPALCPVEELEQIRKNA